jgi:hypothetical protein
MFFTCHVPVRELIFKQYINLAIGSIVSWYKAGDMDGMSMGLCGGYE